MKHLVTTGCSFTHDPPSWAHFLAIEKNMHLHNVAMSGAGNHVIAAELIRKVELLLSSGAAAADICAIAQWSGIFRFDKIIAKDLNTTDRLVHLANGAKKREFSAHPKNPNHWVMCAGSRYKGIWPTVYTLTSKEQAFMETMENILRVQWYLKHKNIKYKMFNGWDIFTDGVPTLFAATDTGINVNQFSEDDYSNIDYGLLKDSCKWFGYLFDMIDWDHFWTHESEKITYGGLTQWVKETLPKNIWFLGPNDCHPSAQAHEEFVKRVLMEIL